MIELPGESHWVAVDGINTHYVEAGAGQPLLLIHGLGASVLTWRDNIGPLAESFRVIALDLPGHGNSDKPDIDYAAPTIVRLIARFVEAIGIEKTAIVGNSVGGALGLMVALAYPDLVSGLVLVGSAGLGKEISTYVKLASIPLLGRLLESPKFHGTKFMLHNVFHDPSLASPELIEELYRSRQMPGAKEAVVRVIHNVVNLRGVRDEYVRIDELKDLPMPTMIVWGAEDRIFPVSHAYRAADSSPQTVLKVFEECGHWPHMEKATAFNSAVTKFLSR